MTAISNSSFVRGSLGGRPHLQQTKKLRRRTDQRRKASTTRDGPSKGKKRKRVENETESEEEYAPELDMSVKDEDGTIEGSWTHPIYVE